MKDNDICGTPSPFALAIDFGGTKIAMATASSAGRRLQTREIATLASEGAERVMQRTFAAARELVEATAAQTGQPLRAIAAVTPGIVEPDGIRLAPNNPGWERLALKDVLRNAFDVASVSVETDVKAAALAEARDGALAGVDCGLYVNVGTGLAAAAVVGGRVLRGAHGAAGEIGYLLRGVPGERHFADGAAPLEEHVSGAGISARASALLGRAVSAREAFALAQTQPEVAALIDDALDALALHVANAAIMLDPARIAIGGGMARVPAVAARIEALVRRAAPCPPEVCIAAFGHDAALQGAIVAAADALTTR
ncbi:ROK family protein [Paraburkholderia bannensis]|uniref:ROK family protein n=1 Tax=Paraburkholderia bannensis TaxID=765414 RepID=UPI002AAFE5C4|nr:ROK family protein [Paraburkholderia bannensis]